MRMILLPPHRVLGEWNDSEQEQPSLSSLHWAPWLTQREHSPDAHDSYEYYCQSEIGDDSSALTYFLLWLFPPIIIITTLTLPYLLLFSPHFYFNILWNTRRILQAPNSKAECAETPSRCHNCADGREPSRSREDWGPSRQGSSGCLFFSITEAQGFRILWLTGEALEPIPTQFHHFLAVWSWASNDLSEPQFAHLQLMVQHLCQELFRDSLRWNLKKHLAGCQPGMITQWTHAVTISVTDAQPAHHLGHQESSPPSVAHSHPPHSTRVPCRAHRGHRSRLCIAHTSFWPPDHQYVMPSWMPTAL